MGYRTLADCVNDLDRRGELVRISTEVDPYLEMAEIQRRVYEVGGPAIYFERVKGSPFPAVSNLFGTFERGRYILRHGLERTQRVVQIKADPPAAMKRPWRYGSAPLTAIRSLPRKSWRNALTQRCRLDELPQIHSWPDDGGAYITLPQVLTEDPNRPGPMGTNVGMYRVQLAGNEYRSNEQVGLHFQIHRGIGIHYSRAKERGEPLKVSIFVGGPPAHSFSAVMPLPDGLSELIFAGMLAGRRFAYHRSADGHFLSNQADFCIVGHVKPDALLPEGPFGDHLGYYSLTHPFPVLDVERVYHRPGAIWPFTVVGRPPQEDTTFGKLIHEITAPLVPKEISGLKEMHAVDEAGVHPLLVAIGHERYVPYEPRQPREILTVANAVLGFGQASLAKYLIIAAHEDDPTLTTHDLAEYFAHVLRRVHWRRDLHFQTSTTMDTLDYSGTGLNSGSKVVIAAAGPPIRVLSTDVPTDLPSFVRNAGIAGPGILALEIAPFVNYERASREVEEWAAGLDRSVDVDRIPLVILVDDVEFVTQSLRNFLWVTFTRSNPSHDMYGIRASQPHKHWGCDGPMIIDARQKQHHAPPLIEDPQITRRVEDLAKKGGPLAGIL